jgi:hypothetical protein
MKLMNMLCIMVSMGDIPNWLRKMFRAYVLLLQSAHGPFPWEDTDDVRQVNNGGKEH